MQHQSQKKVLVVIVVAQFFCTSLWFAGNAILPDLTESLNLGSGFLAHITSSVQFGFISGTLVFAVLTISDRFSPSRVFFLSSIIAGVFNLGVTVEGIRETEILLFRFGTGFFLAGIYPVGMKIASDYFQKGLGISLGFLVGALVLGTAFPHLVNTLSAEISWKAVAYVTTLLSVIGGLSILLLVPDGPYRKASARVSLGAFLSGFRHANFRTAAFGYFGHMWELYTFWAFLPIMLTSYKNHWEIDLDVSLWSFLIIASGGFACFLSGWLSQYFGVKRIATISLLLSCSCCLISPWLLFTDSILAFVGFLLFWGLVVIADSPLFSTLVAQSAPVETRGTSLTMVNCIGFTITIVSIQCIGMLFDHISTQHIYTLLAIGPLFGIIALLSNQGD